MEIQPAWGIQRPSREQIDAIGNKELGQGTITWGRDSKKIGGEQLVFQVGPSMHHSIHKTAQHLLIKLLCLWITWCFEVFKFECIGVETSCASSILNQLRM